MSIYRIISYPAVKFHGFNKEITSLSRCYDMGSRIAKNFALPGKSYLQIGEALNCQIIFHGLKMDRASISGKNADIISCVNKSLEPFGKQISSAEQLEQMRLVKPSGRWGKIKWLLFDPFLPIKEMKALDRLIEKEISPEQGMMLPDEKMHAMKDYIKELERNLRIFSQKLGNHELGQKAYAEIISAIYRAGSEKDLFSAVQEMFNVVTKWAYQVIGQSPESESAGWVVVGPDGRIGMPMRYLKIRKGKAIEDNDVLTLRKNEPGRNGGISLPDIQTSDSVNEPECGNFICVKEWENIKIREDLVAIEMPDGQKKAYRRHLKHGSEMAGYLARGAASQKIGKTIGSLLGKFAEAVVATVGAIKHFENAFVELEEIDLDQDDINEGDLVPLVKEGTVIKLISAGSANPNLRTEKREKGEILEETAKKAGLEVGIVNQGLEKAVGNVRTASLKPLAYMIKNIDSFKVRPQNRFLISIVGVESYFIRTLLEFNKEGEAVCLGCLEVTNPEIIPERLNQEEQERLTGQFEIGRIFTDMVSSGIMVKVLQEEVSRLTEQYLGEKVYKLIKDRDFDSLRGSRIKDATVIFADVAGFTALSEKLKDQPESVVSMLSKLFAHLDPLVIKNGGMIDKHVGDCIMAVFGVPDRNDGDIDSSVRAAIELQMELQKFNLTPFMKQFYAANGLKPLGITVGVNTGTLIAGNLGHEGSKVDYSVIGSDVNEAARFQSAAKRGQIVIGARTFDRLSDKFKKTIVEDFNIHNKKVSEIKKMIMERLRLAGKKADEADIDDRLERYLELYEEVDVNDIFVPSVIWAKNIGPIPCFYVRWDRHEWRYGFLKSAGIELPEEPEFENQPQGVNATKEIIGREKDPDVRKQMAETFENFLASLGKS